MPRLLYVEHDFGPSALKVIRQANGIIADYAAQGYDLTLRQLYYQFVSRDLIPNRQSEYKRLGDIINDARLAGLVDWEALGRGGGTRRVMVAMRTLPTHYQLELTEALRGGASRVEQCSWCGLLVATTNLASPPKLGPCPACGCTTWWRQTPPVGPFRVIDEAPAAAPACTECGRPEAESPGFVQYLRGPVCRACREAALVGEVD